MGEGSEAGEESNWVAPKAFRGWPRLYCERQCHRPMGIVGICL
jgi:hypothetical protein